MHEEMVKTQQAYDDSFFEMMDRDARRSASAVLPPGR
jgi:hypothetical protein